MENMLYLQLQDQYFDAIESGLKTVEGRINSSKFKDLRVGMHIKFTSVSTHKIILCRIEKINRYANFKDMLVAQGLEQILPGITNIDDAVALYEIFPGYKEQVNIIGALAITIKKIQIL